MRYAEGGREWAWADAKTLPNGMPVLEERQALDLLRRAIAERRIPFSYTDFPADVHEIEQDNWFS